MRLRDITCLGTAYLLVSADKTDWVNPDEYMIDQRMDLI